MDRTPPLRAYPGAHVYTVAQLRRHLATLPQDLPVLVDTADGAVPAGPVGPGRWDETAAAFDRDATPRQWTAVCLFKAAG